MNLFIIPSWYPSQENPIAGIFFKEQAASIAEFDNNIQVGVSLWGQSDPSLVLNKNISASVKNILVSLARSKTTSILSVEKNLHEIYTPSLSWTHKVLNGNINRIVEANLLNLADFEKKVGKVNIIHAHVSYPAGYIAMKLAQIRKIPYIITEHMGPFPFPSFLTSKGELNPFLSEPISRASRTLAVSPKLADDIHSFGFKRPLFIPNVINEGFFNIDKPVDSAPFKFFTLANLSPEKGIDDLLQAIRIITKKHLQVTFNIGGGGPLLELYQKKTSDLNIEKIVNWLGPLTREEAREQYHRCNAFILPSHGETFGVVYAEAIACGKPVIATRCGGPECIVNEKNGLFAEIGNPNDLAEKMDCLIKYYHQYQPDTIRKGFEEKFSKQAVIPQILEVYRTISKNWQIDERTI
jgi:glycosyltransferase involved in cell wall biosynthesis